MQSFLSILREVRDPRDFNARHELAAILFISLAATLCGAKSCVAIADFAAANVELLAEIVDLPHGAPSHDCFSRLFRLLDPDEMARVFSRFVAAMREGLGLGPAKECHRKSRDLLMVARRVAFQHAAMEREAAMNIATGKLFSAHPIDDCLLAGELTRRPRHTIADDDGHIPHHAVREKRMEAEAAAEKFLIDEQRRKRLAVNPAG